MTLLANALLVTIGLAGGIAVGSGFVAFITVLDIIPRLTLISKTFRSIPIYEYAIILGVLSFTWVDFRDLVIRLSLILLIVIGLAMGIFVGLLAAALTEVINVIPILAKRLKMESHIIYLLMAMAFGKVAGSLFQWLFFST